MKSQRRCATTGKAESNLDYHQYHTSTTERRASASSFPPACANSIPAAPNTAWGFVATWSILSARFTLEFALQDFDWEFFLRC
jgi:hypothetical protein